MRNIIAKILIALTILLALAGIYQITIFWMVVSDMDSMETPYYCEQDGIEYQCTREEYNDKYHNN